MTLMRQLQDVMRTENGLLREMRLARLQELQAEKAALAETYELELRRLRQAPETTGQPRAPTPRQLLETACASSRRRCGAMPSGCCSRAAWSRPSFRSIGESLGTAAKPARRLWPAGRRRGRRRSARVIPVAFDRRC